MGHQILIFFLPLDDLKFEMDLKLKNYFVLSSGFLRILEHRSLCNVYKKQDTRDFI